MPYLEIVPNVGFKPKIPVNDAGLSTEPPVCEPIAKGIILSETAAAEPEETKEETKEGTEEPKDAKGKGKKGAAAKKEKPAKKGGKSKEKVPDVTAVKWIMKRLYFHDMKS